MKAGGRTRRGFGLMEAMIAIFLLSILSLSVAYMYQYLFLVTLKTRENTYTSRLSSSAFAKLRTVEYYYLFPYDSAISNYGLSGNYGPVTLQRAAYPYRGVLQAISSLSSRYAVDRWSLETKFKLRDVSDVNGNGLTSDLRDFADANADLKDDFDPGVRYYKANGDADYYDTYVSTALNKTASELPDTNLKEVTLKLYRRGKVIHTQTDLISLEMLSGIENRSSGADLKMFVNQPANDTCLYDLTQAARLAAFNLPISKPYPPEVTAYRADSSFPLRLWGETVPLANVNFYVNSMTALADSRQAPGSGEFDLQSPAVTAALGEGVNNIYAQAVKDSYFSPFAPRRVTLDLNPPQISAQAPFGTVPELMPYVGAALQDNPLSAGAVSGICPEVIALKANGALVQHSYDQASGKVSWKDQATGLPPRLVNGGAYTVVLEGGDNAYYKASSTWTFTVSVPATDNSPPALANKIPMGGAADALPLISCRVFDNQSGIDPYSIALKVDGVVAVSSAAIAAHWDPETGTVSYTPAAAFQPGSDHTVEVAVSHWADDPPDRKTHVETWNFTVAN